jgi:hypothetical protein
MTIVTQWYEKTLWIAVWLLFVPPLGIYGMWKSSRTLFWKIVVTLIFGGAAITWISMVVQMMTAAPAGN